LGLECGSCTAAIEEEAIYCLRRAYRSLMSDIGNGALYQAVSSWHTLAGALQYSGINAETIVIRGNQGEGGEGVPVWYDLLRMNVGEAGRNRMCSAFRET